MVLAGTNDHVSKCIPAPVGGLPMGTRIQDYSIKGVIGEGGFAIVYLAEDVLLHRQVAIKEYMPAALAVRGPDRGVEPRSASHGDTFTKGMRSFINEARLLAQFKHPALIDVLRFWEENGTAYMAMPYYQGKTLRELLRQSDFRCTETWLRRLIEPILSGLQTMHRENCFHRDISTDNIIVLASGNPVLLDFGAARRIVAAPDQMATIILKPGFAPVEQYSDDIATAPQGPWTDIYALCAVCYLAISGRMPTTSVARIMRDPVIPLASMAPPGFSARFLSAIDKGLAVRPEDRPQTIKEFIALLDSAGPIARYATPMPSRSAEPATAPPERRHDAHPADPQPPVATAAQESRESKAEGTSAAAGDSALRRRSTDRPDESLPDPGPKTVPLEHTTVGKAPPPRPQEPAASRSNRTVLIGVAVALGLIVLLGYWRFTSPAAPAADEKPAGGPTAAIAAEQPSAPAVEVTPKPEPSVALPAETPAPTPTPEMSPTPAPAPTQPVPPPKVEPAPPVQVAEPVAPPPAAQQPKPVAPAASRPRQPAAPDAPARATSGTKAAPPAIRKPAATDVAGAPAAPTATKPAEPASPTASKGTVEDSRIKGASKGAVDIRINPWGTVSVDGRSYGAAPPLRRVWLPVGKHTVVLSNPGARSFTTEIVVGETGAVEVAHDFAAAPAKPR